MVDCFASVVVQFRVPILCCAYRATLTVVLVVPDADAMLVVPDACCFSHSFRGVSYADVELHVLESCLELSEALSTVLQHL